MPHPFPIPMTARSTRCVLMASIAVAMLGCDSDLAQVPLSDHAEPHSAAAPTSSASGPPTTSDANATPVPNRRFPQRLIDQNVRIRDEFMAISERIKYSDNKYLGQNQITQLQRALSRRSSPRSGQDIETTVNLWLQLCFHQLRLGQIEEAKHSIDEAFQIVEHSGRRPAVSMHKLRALVYLREAEYRNCVQRHNCECCVFPLAGGGIHSVKEPMVEVRKSLLELLSQSPTNLEAGWLLNISGMALGGYPDSIPASYRLPQTIFDRRSAVPRFVDVAPGLGVDRFDLCGGAIVEDIDGDHLLDIVTSTYDLSEPMTYFRNVGDGTFDDLSVSSQLSSQLSGLNCISADYDNDGDPDILLLRGAWLYDDGQLRNSLLRNLGDGTFSDVTQPAGLAEPARPTQAAVWGDFDNDGWLDLYIGNESRVEMNDAGPTGIDGGAGLSGGNYPSQLFRNNGDGTFTDVASAAGVTNDRYCKGVAAGDYDNDGDLDIYVSNSNTNRLYRNNGDWTFTDVALDLGVGDPHQWSFACWFFDYNNDGWLDLFVAAYQSTVADVAADFIGIPHQGIAPCLYRNRGDGTFENVASETGLNHAYMPMGANFGDFDNDGWLDIYLTTGSPDFASLTPNVLLQNDQGDHFQDVTFSAGVGHLQKGHGIAFADIDNDGDQDIYHQLGGFFPGDKFHNSLFLNSCVGCDLPCGNNRFVAIKLIGDDCNRQAVGARLRVVTDSPSGQVTRHRAIGMVSSFGGSPSRQEIGLGDAESIVRIEIDWPRPHGERRTQTVHGVSLDSFVEITQGDSTPRVLALPRLSF